MVYYSKNELEAMTKTEVSNIAKDLGVKRYNGKSLMPKEEIIANICKVIYEHFNTDNKNEAVSEVIEQGNDDANDREAKEKRIASAPIGTLIAFCEPEIGKLNTAKITNRNKSKKLIKCETKYGKEFLIPFSNVKWVKTGLRWPKGIYNELKGIK